MSGLLEKIAGKNSVVSFNDQAVPADTSQADTTWNGTTDNGLSDELNCP